MGDFDGVRALVTGAASGIGAETARVLLERGAAVAALDVDPDVPAGCLPLAADLRDDAAVRTAVAEAAEVLGGLDVVVNVAGIGAVGTVSDNADDEWARVWDVNVVGTVRVCRAALPHLLRSDRAAIVTTSSVVAYVGVPARALYSATKGAVTSLTLAMAADLVVHGVRVTAVAPGTADTPWVARLLAAADDPDAHRAALEARQPIGRLVSAREVAESIAYLAAPTSAATTGTVLHVDGGMLGIRLPR